MPVSDPRAPWKPSQPPLRTWTETNSATKDQVLVLSTSLGDGAPLPKGDYFVSSGSARFNSALAFSVVDTALVTKVSFDEVLVWALDLESGKPLPGLTLNASEYGNVKDGPPNNTLASTTATTGADGLASFKLKEPESSTTFLDGRPRYLVTLDSGGRRGVEATSWQQGSYGLEVPQEYFQRAYVGHIYTERPIYRPGEDVLFKGIVREDDDAHYAVPDGTVPLEWVIRDAQGKELARTPVSLNSFGSFAGSFTLPASAAIGDYTVQIEEPGGGPQQRHMPITGTSFNVAEFRKPEFQVEVTSDKPAYASGDTITVNALATFFFGGGVSGAKVDWNVMATPTRPSVPGYERYSFGDIDFAQRNVVRDPQRATGASSTDASGKSVFTTPAALKGGEGAQAFQISALVSDQSGQGVAGVTSVTVHPADGYAGIRPGEYVTVAGEEAKIHVVTVDNEGKPVANRQVTVGVYERTWVTTKEQTPEGARRYRSDPVDKLLATIPVTTDAKGEATVSYTPTKSGQVRLTADYTDAKGRTARSASYLWVSSGQFASWQVTNDDIVKLVADRDQYEVGDTAEVLVPAPFAGAIGLVTTERGKIISRTVQPFPTNAERLSIPVNDGSVPNIFVGVVLYRPPTAEDPIPRYKMGYAQLSVSTKSRQLNVEITPDRAQAKPGDKVAYDIKVTDSAGKGVKSEVSVAVVDKAVLSLMEERSVTGLRAFWFERGLGVQTSSSLAVSIDRWNDVIGEPRQGGKGGSGGEDRLRQDFKNTAYWEAQLPTKEDGTLRVEVTMPDNLTTWRLQARAISGNTMVGEATNELVSTQPLLLRPALPRFLRVGDQVRLRLLVRNATDKATDVTVTLAAEGVEVSGGAEKKANVKPGESAVLEWPASVSREGEAKLTFRATGSGGLSDSIVQALPIYLDVTPEAMATNGVVTDESQAEGVYLPGFALLKNGFLDVSVQPTLTGSLTSNLSRFKKRPGELLEPTSRVAGRAIATMAIVRAEKSAGRSTDSYEPQIATDLATLVGRQRPDGGFAWCEHPLCQSDPQVTGWVLTAFGEALRDGRTVDTGAASRTRDYVSTYINRVTDVLTPADVNEKAQLLYALDASIAEGGSSSASIMRSLLQQHRATLANWGRAYLILGLLGDGAAKEDQSVSQLLNDLSQSMISSATGNHWEDERVHRSAHTGVRTTSLVLMALVRADPGHPLIEETVRWL
ncbi:MAG: hypothetical protein IT304_03530, partial [Dehalococcoidia bacterium]|nr:hypothetical protein [Dehalococcoidia bacterium]